MFIEFIIFLFVEQPSFNKQIENKQKFSTKQLKKIHYVYCTVNSLNLIDIFTLVEYYFENLFYFYLVIDKRKVSDLISCASFFFSFSFNFVFFFRFRVKSCPNCVSMNYNWIMASKNCWASLFIEKSAAAAAVARLSITDTMRNSMLYDKLDRKRHKQTSKSVSWLNDKLAREWVGRAANRRVYETNRIVVVVNIHGGVDDEMDLTKSVKNLCSLVLLPFSLSLFISLFFLVSFPFLYQWTMSLLYQDSHISLVEQIPITMLIKFN